jgi:hypothetical protein
MKILGVLSIVFMFFIHSAYSQSRDERFNRDYANAIRLVKMNNYGEAVKILKRLYLKDADNQDVLFNLANSYMNTSDGADSAVIYYNKALELLPADQYNTLYAVELHLSLAKALQLVKNPAKALEIYSLLENRVSTRNAELDAELRQEKEYCNTAIEFMKNPVTMEVTNLPVPLNSKYNDHSPLLTADESMMVFTSRRPAGTQIMDDGQYPERIFVSRFVNNAWSRPVAIKSLFKSDGHEAAVHISADGRYLFIYRVDIQGQNLYRSEFDGETWSSAEKMPAPISSRFDETHICLSADGTVAYFTSNRPGGYGGFDIYRSRQLPDGNWGVPQNLGPSVNTPEDEESPVLHPDGKTLYFSSRGHKSMGGFDIFYSKEVADSTWTDAVNLGYPVNSADDDIFFVPTTVRNRAFYASTRFEPKVGGIDLYEIGYEEPEDARLAVLKGRINASVPIDNVRISVFDDDGDMVGIYKPNPVSGKYIMILVADKNYNLEYEGAGFEKYAQPLFVDGSKAYGRNKELVTIGDITMVADKDIASAQTPVADVGKDGMDDDGIPWYTVQVLSLRQPVDNPNAWDGLNADEVKEYKYADGWYVYTVGSYKGFKAAVKAKQEIIEKTKYDDSFVRDPKQYEKFLKKESGNDK